MKLNWFQEMFLIRQEIKWYCSLILYSVPSIFIPLIFRSYRIALANVSVDKMRICRESRHPCLFPRGLDIIGNTALNVFIKCFDPRY